MSPVFSNVIDFFPSTEYAVTVSFNMFELAIANAPTGNLQPDSTYSDILGDYAGSTEGQTAGSLDEWD